MLYCNVGQYGTTFCQADYLGDTTFEMYGSPQTGILASLVTAWDAFFVEARASKLSNQTTDWYFGILGDSLWRLFGGRQNDLDFLEKDIIWMGMIWLLYKVMGMMKEQKQMYDNAIYKQDFKEDLIW